MKVIQNLSLNSVQRILSAWAMLHGGRSLAFRASFCSFAQSSICGPLMNEIARMTCQ